MKKLPIGISDFRDLIDDNYYFVDKSLFIKEIIDRGDKVLLIPRPRRFGKTLNMSMIKYFYGCNIAPAIGKTDPDNEHLFTHLNIWKAGKEYTEKQGKYPVIFLSFKDIKDQDFETSLEKIRALISTEFKLNKIVRDSLDIDEKEYYDKIIKKSSSLAELSYSLNFLMKALSRHYNRRIILLIDEYDSPIHASFVNGFYDDMINFMRNFLSAGLKDTSEYLEKSIITGIMRVARESIFSGLNNLGVYTILRDEFSEFFGFTENEVKRILKEKNALERLDSLKKWYDGYNYGNRTIFNPWSIINYAASSDFVERPYWVNTSQNEIVDQLLRNGGHELKKEMEILLSGESIERVIQDDIVFSEVFSNDKMLWSFILMGGYLKHEFVRKNRADRVYKLTIPNIEVERTFTKILDNYFQEATDYNKIEEMLKYLKKGEIEVFE
ncbi:MAG: AAA family ATPase, partial [bacterium]